MSQFNRQFVESFQTAGDPKFGVVFNAAAMYGFWVDKLGRYVLPKNLVGIWPEIAVLIILLSGIGLISARRRVFAWILFVIGLIALVFGVGTAFAPFAGIFFWCFYHVPFFKGFREPEKFIGLLVLTYSFLGACGAKVVADNSKRFFAKHNELVGDFVLPLLILGLPFFYTPTELWGFSGQIKPTNYPSDWYVVNKQLNADHSNFKVLFLPWHQYLSFSFSPGVIGNPATNFFDKPTIEGNNLELGRIYTQVNTPTSLYIEQQILTLGPSVTDIGKRLDHLNIKYVILAKNFDVNQYLWLGKQNDVSLLSDSKNLLVYKNKAWKPGKPSSH